MAWTSPAISCWRWKVRRCVGARNLVGNKRYSTSSPVAKDMRVLLKRIEGAAAELRPGVLAPMSARRVLLRLQENVRARRLAAGDTEPALNCTLDMLRIAPDMAALWRDAAMMHQRLDQVSAALKCYARVLDLVPEGDTAIRARMAMDELRSRLN